MVIEKQDTKKTKNLKRSMSQKSTNSFQKKTKVILPVDNDRVLALSMRPTGLHELIGQENIVESIEKQIKSGRLPHFFIISGPVGAGKTTLARILSHKIIGSADVQEINAANKNGVDDIRDLVERMKYKPVYPSKHKVVILDEAHQLTQPAQNALLTETEDVANHVFYIFCTSAITKIIPGLKRRAFIINPEPLKHSHIKQLIQYAIDAVSRSDVDIDSLSLALQEASVTSPGLVLQATERYLSGLSASNSVLFTNDSKIDPLLLCRAVASGQWSSCSQMLNEATKNDIPALRNSVLGYLKAILLKSTGSKAINISKAITHMAVDTIRADEGAALPLFIASVCMACDSIKGPIKKVIPSTTST